MANLHIFASKFLLIGYKLLAFSFFVFDSIFKRLGHCFEFLNGNFVTLFHLNLDLLITLIMRLLELCHMFPHVEQHDVFLLHHLLHLNEHHLILFELVGVFVGDFSKFISLLIPVHESIKYLNFKIFKFLHALIYQNLGIFANLFI